MKVRALWYFKRGCEFWHTLFFCACSDGVSCWKMCRYYGFFLVEKKPTALFVFLYICGYMAHIALLTYTYKWSNMKDIDKKWLEKWETVKEKTEVVWTFMKFKICLNFWGVFGPWRRSVASYTTDERLKNGQKERWRLNLEEINLQIKSSSEKFRWLLKAEKEFWTLTFK